VGARCLRDPTRDGGLAGLPPSTVTMGSCRRTQLEPDWICEVLSPSTAVLDRTRKQDIYREHGVPWLWFVDPAARTVEVLRLSAQDLVVAGTVGGEGEKRVPPFDAVAIDIGSLWDAPGCDEPVATASRSISQLAL
jgi:hypothetical protein